MDRTPGAPEQEGICEASLESTPTAPEANLQAVLKAQPDDVARSKFLDGILGKAIAAANAMMSREGKGSPTPA